ncbi:MAG TPA: Rieske 2Fe-2S domain-containing protein [Actinomycetota bacterium]|nr:Rieske 2Fe-2S domain-containing protein [Actinomycetota bacterium]
MAEPPREVWVRAAAPPPGGAARISSGDVAVAVFDVDGQLVAFDDRCLHKSGSLSRGYLHDGTVTCAEHWWRYDLRTGERVGSPWLCLRRYHVERDGDAVRVAIPERPSGVSMRERLLTHAREWTADR